MSLTGIRWLRHAETLTSPEAEIEHQSAWVWPLHVKSLDSSLGRLTPHRANDKWTTLRVTRAQWCLRYNHWLLSELWKFKTKLMQTTNTTAQQTSNVVLDCWYFIAQSESSSYPDSCFLTFWTHTVTSGHCYRGLTKLNKRVTVMCQAG